MDPFILKNKQYFVIEEWTKRFPELAAGFTTKNGGCSEQPFSELNVGLHVNDRYEAVSQNRETVADTLCFPINCWVGAEQTHEIHIQKIAKENIGKGSLNYEDSFKGTDGFYTSEKGVLLTLCYADCVPLYFFHPKTGAIGIAHAGWKGTVNGIGRDMVKYFKREGIDEKDVLAAIGPSICEKCYIVDHRVIALADKILEDTDVKPYTLIEENQYQLNLKELNRQILLKEGIPERNIAVTDYCTSCNHDQFFSHRRDNGKTGRMMGFIGWKEDIKA